MSVEHLSLDAVIRSIEHPSAAPWIGSGSAHVVVVDLDASTVDRAPVVDRPALHAGVPAVIVGVTSSRSVTASGSELCDLVVGTDDEELASVLATVEARPLASAAFVALLRGAPGRSLDDGLLVESATYSTLQGGPEFATWRASRPSRPPRSKGDAVRLDRDGDIVHITLTRPEVRNALDTLMRDQLVDAFELVALDPSITRVHLRGDGESFCSGGDLDEFGSFPDPATAHLVRLRQSVGRAISAVSTRVTAHLHGACLGSGIELPAFAGRVIAAPSTRIGLPELGLGLVPGAGGTVSLPRRIGRHRTAWLGLTGRQIDAAVALEWGLVDELTDR